jgi:hypothetical protein
MKVDLRIVSKASDAGFAVVIEDQHGQVEACAPTLQQAMHDGIDMYFEMRAHNGERRSSFRLDDDQLVVAVGLGVQQMKR